MFSYMTLFFFWEKGKYMEAWAIVLTRVLPTLSSTRIKRNEVIGIENHKLEEEIERPNLAKQSTARFPFLKI